MDILSQPEQNKGIPLGPGQESGAKRDHVASYKEPSLHVSHSHELLVTENSRRATPLYHQNKQSSESQKTYRSHLE